MFNFDRQKIILTINKYISYVINMAIVAVIVSLVVFWVQTLIQSAQS